MNTKGIIKGLHHVTATVGDAQEDYDFYVKTLGLRLVKETVNFDNENVYHFYYANRTGTPSTVFTTFPYRGQGVRQGSIGTGQTSHTAFSVPADSLDFWRQRLEKHDISFSPGKLFGLEVLNFKDPSGLNIQLVGAERDAREPVWEFEDITKKEAVRGIHHVRLLLNENSRSQAFLEAFGYETRQEENNLILMEAGEGGPGNTLILQADQNQRPGINGLGTVHHVAHRVDELSDSLRMKDYLENQLGIMTTEVKDRNYFQSIYFRMPGGIIFEIATSGPGFLVDETEEELGTLLKLPEWMENYREQIAKGLPAYQR
ncbi:MAG: VOC family protein [Cyclobacteriaceae bacterium]